MFLLAFNKQLKLLRSSACFCAVFSKGQTRIRHQIVVLKYDSRPTLMNDIYLLNMIIQHISSLFKMKRKGNPQQQEMP
ncbi:hypothetical protein T4C_458 [Trichinella pseudospiralis]|uniref:Uncharacterized protein n=1 Tax=Trichinella pseudospiralis TaxID=6337 RepID=A0A0V1KCW3_TRIPS|nr:hypothetical protein T4C_458 [Trichinella pseudospiralis]